jgi:hypothetical protein
MIAVLSDDSEYYTNTKSTVNVTTVELIARREGLDSKNMRTFVRR